MGPGPGGVECTSSDHHQDLSLTCLLSQVTDKEDLICIHSHITSIKLVGGENERGFPVWFPMWQTNGIDCGEEGGGERGKGERGREGEGGEGEMSWTTSDRKGPWSYWLRELS